MSAQPTTPTAPPDHVSIEIDGQQVFAPKGSMIIQAADRMGLAIPRFCYHEKLAIAANCRMCMVEVEMGGRPMPKPQPSCATPVADGMKVFTQSQRALSAQRNAMEFLLINHPLDCPICDQGGECELQDLSLGFGRSVSRFVERKRVVADENLGPLVETEMTRCIHCTRCIRVMAEVAGTYELGGMERGESLQIGTYVGKPLMSELSGNVIDVCPVGALTNKPFRFRARAWELLARESFGYHDALGSNLWLHTRRGEVLRTVPRDNEAINECWLSDRDRYSHEGLMAADRASMPMIRKNGELVETTWTEALAFVADHLRKAGGDLGTLVAPLTSSEEGHLLAQLVRGLGSDDIDHRLRQIDLSDAPQASTFETSVADLEKTNAIVLIGCNPRHEMPLLNHRLRKAVEAGAKVWLINPLDFDFNFPLTGKQIAKPSAMLDHVLGLARAANDAGKLPASSSLARVLANAKADDSAQSLVSQLAEASASVIILGESAVQHANAAWLRSAAKFIARATDSGYNELPSGANAIGLTDAGVSPQKAGRDAVAMLANPPKSLIVYHAGSADFANPAAFDKARSDADFYLYIGAFACEGVRSKADAVLPIGLLPEIDASFTNVDGFVQTVAAGAKPPGDARPGWKVLRALGSALALEGFGFTEIAEVRAQMSKASAKTGEPGELANPAPAPGSFERIATTAIYRVDAVLRRSPALNAHPLTRGAMVSLNPADATTLGLGHGDKARVNDVVLGVELDPAVPPGAAWVEAGYAEVGGIPAHGSALKIARVSA
ncbi:MAG TPA: NADH-quinone oxidoreductase subunit NuoG [Dokdonella sp.]|uniref:NADH-quinone oxidoreductase subunit NuoG n=1 Tax=Dokdonella sp. TaxID=2291710 RepID=UPI002D7EEBD2|nr:NADH-quinone oxidoreductase subunit NuoG [Dokdonella sp.]HET9032591.1 NADH-quinone oxidoreductase subunit NuoG [Dokdonella sp.]